VPTEPAPVPPPPHRSLRTRLVRLMGVSIAVASIATLATVAWMNVRISRDHLAAIEYQLAASIEAKGKVLTENQALALKGMVADNAFGDVDRMVRRVVAEDSDVVYGLFVSSDGKPWAYYAPDRPPGPADAAVGPSNDLGGWKRLGVVPPDDAATTTRVTHRALFDQELVELAMPVRDGSEVLGAIYYGLSTRSVGKAREAARAESRAALIQTLSILAAVSIGITLLFLFLAMRQASRITRPLGALTAAAGAIAGGRRDAHVEIDSGDELELLGGAFNRMVRDLDASYSQLEDMNKNLEQRVEQRTAELASRNRDMRLVLDNVDQGFITVDLDGIMAIERSAVVDRWLGSYGAGTAFSELVGAYDGNFAAMFDLGLEAIRDGWMPLELNLLQLPLQMTAGPRQLRFVYSPVLDDGKLCSLLVVIADVTERLEHERREMAQRAAWAVFAGVMRDRRGFLAFYQEADQLVGAVSDGSQDADLPTLKRLVHTLKGNAAIFGLSRIAELCHDIENSIDEAGGPPRPELREALVQRWRELDHEARSVIGDGCSVVISDADYESLVGDLAASSASPKVVRKVAAWRLDHVHTALSRLGDKARVMADRLGKPGLAVVVDGGGLAVDPRRWDRFWSETVHVLRNAVDHGIELPVVRQANGKPPTGTLALQARITDGCFVLTVADDGSGIDWSTVASHARARGLPAESQDDLLTALFSSGFSTRDQVTTTSGRGVGLDAVRQVVASLDGRIEIDSEPGRGTTFRFVFPEDTMAGGYYRELEARLSSLDYLASLRRRRDSLAATRVG
jgi:signal transduction histidine kinase/HPt (histidine-containing phosphotransfer) domain-containing protein